ncbi:MAG TPA: SUMF1/EgtB/PvdO family nonheme iron enzyme [Candidatus Limnocylindrales bacterium]|nr:SUMF1/EgtB/PvdO family nonheme iron enzyme [Candidatus Limnocylindrales bacterium]
MPDPHALGQELSDARRLTDDLFRVVRPDHLYARPIAERHRIVFYLGHLEAFDWNLLARYALDVPAFHPTFDNLFAFGIDPPPGRLPDDVPADWPSIAEIERYNQRTRDEIDSVLDRIPEQLMHAAIEHRLMHAETLAYILHQLPYTGKVASADAHSAVPRPASREEFHEIPAGLAALGLNPDHGFGWDNEFPAHTVPVGGFRVARYKVTNREYLEFVEQGAEAPFFWTPRAGRWHYRGMFSEVPLPLEAPVYATHAQAQAFAAWKGKRLLTEPEFHRAACGASPDPEHNYDFRYWDPVPVTAGPAGNGAHQLFGNGWEWTSTPFAPFEGFEPFPFYRNYSEPFFDGAHYVLKGASPRTAARFVRPSFRNWFRPQYPYVYATFRLAES